ncbi:MAG TPA: D-hexose-6-phosphate mutarotase, partial [Rheinheimera sp.]|nr:D-hexose-6-phosphate mutarotase [Rheinheimera sp.]
MTESQISIHTGFAHLHDLPCLVLRWGKATAVVSLYGAQVLSYRPENSPDLLWLSPLANWHNGSAIRGGIPICWPWFGPAEKRLMSNAGTLPNHGLVRNRMWQLTEQSCDETKVSITLSLTLSDLPQTTSKVTVNLTVTLSAQLAIKLYCDNALLQQAALHSYFAINDISRTKVHPLPPVYQDKLLNALVDAQQTETGFSAETDRIYADTADKLNISTPKASITLKQDGHDATVVWNPWIEKSQKTADLTDDSYQSFVCVETAKLQLDKPAPL